MVFSWHTPENLIAEMALLGISILVFMYRVLGGSNEWLRTHGIILVTYYAVGGIAYDEIEGWPLLDTTYFLTVSITTVGYGDICPETELGKLFTVLYALIGIVFVFAALSPLVDALMYVKEILLSPCAPPELDDEQMAQLNLATLRSSGNWGFKYGAALAGPGIIFVLGLGIGFFVMQLNLVDGIYWSMITMTTIGYGDISGTKWFEKAVLCIYLPTAVAALADALGVVQTIGTAKMLVETDFAKVADVLLLGEAGGPNPNPDETLTEAEFLISVLKENGIVDDLTVKAIRLQFAHITRHDTSLSDNKVLDDKIVFLEMCAQGRIQQTKASGPPLTPRGRTIEYVDMNAADGGFQEWREAYWWPRVFSGKVGMFDQVRMQPTHQTQAQKDSVVAMGKKYAKLDEEGGRGASTLSNGAGSSKPSTHGVAKEKTKPGGYFSDGTAMADGEYVWMPYEEARKHRAGAKANDGDMCLWWALVIFVGYFLLKMLPTILAEHGLMPSADGGARRQMESVATLLASAKPGDQLTAEMVEQLQGMLSPYRSRR